MMDHNPYTERAQDVHRLRALAVGFGSLLLTFIAPTVSAQTADTFSLPAGCTAFVTVQSKDCTVDHHFTCEGDPDGHQKRVSLDERGMTYLGTIDAEAQWIVSYHTRSQMSEALEEAPADPASFSELLETGIDTYDFTTLSDEAGPTRYVGADTLTGRVVTIDGVALDETTYQITAFDAQGEEMWSSKGNEFISREWRRFLSGTSTVTVPGDSFERDGTPVEFIFPGEPGFMSANPKHGCGVVMSSSPVQALKEFLNVDL